jgi:anaerobic magnesium-protoporphyrin IX monomethyl ester cyclase
LVPDRRWHVHLARQVRMVRALLIKTPKRGNTRDYVAVNLEPLGLMYIAAFVSKFSKHTVSILDAQSESSSVFETPEGYLRMGMTDREIRERIEAFAPRVVGIGALFEVQEAEIINIARIVKSISPQIVVVVGGLDAGTRYADYLNSGVIDYVVRGDGEEPFLEMLDRVDRGESLEGLPGTCERLPSGGMRQNTERTRKIPFDDYPFPERDMLSREYYENPKTQRASFPFASRHPALLMQASRGCTLRCAFCDIVAIQNRWNNHSPEYVVDEIEHCVTRYGTKEVVFVDDNFMLDKKWSLRICELIIERKLKIAFDVMPGVAVWTLSPSVIDTMVEAGLYRVALPVESGNPKTLRFIKKPVDLKKAVENIDYCNRKGLYTVANLIIGFPFETREDIQQTFDWAEKSGLDAVNFYVATPLEGARMFPIYQEHGWLTFKNGRKDSWRTAYFTREELDTLASQASREYMKRKMRFYMNPLNFHRYLLPKLSSPNKFRYAVRLASHMILNGARPTHDDGSMALSDRVKTWLGLSRRPATAHAPLPYNVSIPDPLPERHSLERL